MVQKYELLRTREHLLMRYNSNNFIPIDLRVFRYFQTAYYIQGLYGTLFVDSRNTDRNAFIYHHVVAICLQLLSYGLGFINAGVMIEVLHDCNDVLLHLAKIFNYLQINSN
ncbi:hypothetical protein HZS_364, partial [Henneguya salminicola]